ncbi:hypothetical protein ACROYT_G015162 [Oculina patagonica]
MMDQVSVNPADGAVAAAVGPPDNTSPADSDSDNVQNVNDNMVPAPQPVAQELRRGSQQVSTEPAKPLMTTMLQLNSMTRKTIEEECQKEGELKKAMKKANKSFHLVTSHIHKCLEGISMDPDFEEVENIVDNACDSQESEVDHRAQRQFSIMLFCCKKGMSLVDLCRDLVQQHITGIELFEKFPAFDVWIHINKKEKVYTAHTAQQWAKIRDLLTPGYSLTEKRRSRVKKWGKDNPDLYKEQRKQHSEKHAKANYEKLKKW